MKRFTVMLSSVILCISLFCSSVMASELPKSVVQTEVNVNHIFEQNSSLPMQVAGLSEGEMREKGGVIFFAPVVWGATSTWFWAGVSGLGGAGVGLMVMSALR